MSLKSEIKKLIDKHQEWSDNYHRHAEQFWNDGNVEKSAKADQFAHSHEAFAQELRGVLKNAHR